MALKSKQFNNFYESEKSGIVQYCIIQSIIHGPKTFYQLNQAEYYFLYDYSTILKGFSFVFELTVPHRGIRCPAHYTMY